jgi:hypothetical protein
MDLSEVKAIVNHEETKRYRVTMLNGKTRIVRLWLHNDGCVAIMGKGRKHYGHYLSSYSWDDLNEWVTLKLIEHKPSDKVRLVKKRAQDAVKYLAQSGFWPDIKKEIEYFLENVDIEEFCKDMEKGSYENFYCQRGEGQKYAWCSTYQVFESFYNKNCWKSIPWSKYNRQHESAEVEKAIKDKKGYHRRWTNGYDNTIEITFADECPRGWLSCEYRGCGNGHYYLMFDATHAIFYEDD